MDFKEQVSFGRTRLMVSRIGLASGYGVPTAAIEKAFHEYGVNYLWLSVFMPRGMPRAIRNLAPKHRDEMRIVLAWPAFAGFFSSCRDMWSAGSRSSRSSRPISWSYKVRTNLQARSLSIACNG
jgi:hypothetical protein